MSTNVEEIKTSHSRFSDADWYQNSSKIEIIVGGVGGIGSWLTVLLSRIGYQISAYDMDTVDESNMAGQLYAHDMIGRSKVEAVSTLCGMLSNHSIKEYVTKFDDSSMPLPFMFSCFDNMEARKMMFERWCLLYDRTKDDNMLFIDGRMTAETGQIYFVNPSRIERYKETLFDDSEVEELACSFKATSHNGAIIAGNMVAGFNNHIANINVGEEVYEVPFNINYELPLLMYNVNV